MTQYLSDKRDRFAERVCGLGPLSVSVLGSLAWEADDRSLDDARVEAVAAFGQPLACEVMEQAGRQRRMTRGGGQLKFNPRVLHQPQGAHETEAVGVYVGVQGGFVHEGADDGVGNQEGVQFLAGRRAY